jgi:hypothetical protein
MLNNSIMSIHEHSDTIKKHIISQVEAYALENGIEFPKGSLSKHVTLSREDIDSIINPPKRKNIKFNTKSKPRFNINPKKSDYDLFIKICSEHDLIYFEYYDENNWNGPGLKIDDSVYDATVGYFDSIVITSKRGTDFYIIRPTKQCKNNIKYPEEPIESCKLEPNSLIIVTSDDEAEAEAEAEAEPVAEDIYNATTDSESGEELELEEWIHESKNITYLLDVNTNNLYSIQTNELIGKKLSEFNMEFI